MNVKRFCCDDPSQIEGYADAVNSPDVYDCHHRKEIDNGKVTSRKELKEQGLYYHRPAEELIFLSKAEHRRLHYKGKPHSEEHKRKLSEAAKGKNKGKHWKLVDGKRVWY